MSYTLRPFEECFYCHTEIPIHFNPLSDTSVTSIKCPACKRIMRVSPAMQKEKECAQEIEKLNNQMSFQHNRISLQIQSIENTFRNSKEGKIQELFRQAEAAQLCGEFQQAENLYNQLLTENPNDAEIHWRIVLCHFGVEYVYERNSNTTLPTITKICNESILDNGNYLAALTHAQDKDVVNFYSKEASTISHILQTYLNIYGTQTPYDVFISVKQGNDHGKSTEDSVIAKQLYDKLTSNGLKVFNSAVTLKDYPGHKFEPYIMHALFTAKVMVVIGSKKEYLYAPWVKNEWRRFRWLIDQNPNASRVLIACIIGNDELTIPELGQIQLIYAPDHSAALNPLAQSVLKELSAHSDSNKKKILPLGVAGILIVTALGIYAISESGMLSKVPDEPSFTNIPAFMQSTDSITATPSPTATPTLRVTATPTKKSTVTPTKKVTATPTPKPTPTPTPTLQPAHVPDMNLRNALLEQVGKNKGDTLTIKDLESITSLYLDGLQLKTIEGLQYCINLKWLSLSNNQISNVQPLSELKHLTELYLSDNIIYNISSLSSLKKLTILNLSNNLISDVNSLSKLTALEVLDLSGNQISDIRPLTKLTKLEHLSLQDNTGTLSASVLAQLRAQGCFVLPTPSPSPTPTPTIKVTATPSPTRRPVITPSPTPAIMPMATMHPKSISNYSGSYSTKVSSFFPGNTPTVDGPNAVDNNLNSAWNSDGRITNEWIEMSVRDGKQYWIGGLRIAGGYWKNSTVYSKNPRPRDIEIYCDGQYVASAELDDRKTYQLVWFDEPVLGSKIRVKIISGYYGSSESDLCITEIDLLGPQGIVLNPNAIEDWGSTVRNLKSTVLSGKTLSNGSYGTSVVGLQLLLRDGFGVLDGNTDGSFGKGTETAVNTLAAQMRVYVPNCEYMKNGVVDAAYWRNMIKYMEILNEE